MEFEIKTVADLESACQLAANWQADSKSATVFILYSILILFQI